jgi:hypothetical protein
MNNTNPIADLITPHFCEIMYVHYDEMLQRKDLPAEAVRLLQTIQKTYSDMYCLLTGFDDIVKGLPISKIDDKK